MPDVESRKAARVLIFDEALRILLLEAERPDDNHRFWLTPGGGVDPGETFEVAAAREAFEETGLRVMLGPCVWTRRHLHIWNGRHYDQQERFFVAHTNEVDVAPVLLDAYITGHRWWTLSEIESSADDFAPRGLRRLLPAILAGEFPPEPLDCGV
jgi:8-oxo-dGTP pyrophosphatase MutT (NUDIX family)